MTTQLIQPEKTQVYLRPTFTHSLIKKYREELNTFQKELEFYCQLLELNLENSKKNNHLVALLADFSKMKKSQLPELQNALCSFESKLELGNFAKKMNDFSNHFQVLKLSVFPKVMDLHPIMIW